MLISRPIFYDDIPYGGHKIQNYQGRFSFGGPLLTVNNLLIWLRSCCLRNGAMMSLNIRKNVLSHF